MKVIENSSDSEALAKASKNENEVFVVPAFTGLGTPYWYSEARGAANNDWLLQFQADILGTKVQRAHNLETTTLGAAHLAGLAVGFWESIDEIKNMYEEGGSFEPQMPEEECEKLYKNWKLAVQATKVFKP